MPNAETIAKRKRSRERRAKIKAAEEHGSRVVKPGEETFGDQEAKDIAAAQAKMDKWNKDSYKPGGVNAPKKGLTAEQKATAAKVSKAAGAIGDFASSMAKHSADSFKGLNPSATNVKKGVRPYNYQPERMVPEEATSSMVRFDNEYERQKKKMGL